MDEVIRLELFSVQEVKKWLLTGDGTRGLSESVIAKQRAYAIVNNPYATDNLKIISALFVNDQVVAYTYILPDKTYVKSKEGVFVERLIYWNTVLYCNPCYEGRGFAYCVIGQFSELYGDNYFDLDAAEASVENLKYAGLKVDYVEQYQLTYKSIKTTSLKGLVAKFRENILILIHSKRKQLMREILSCGYNIEYINYIDNETYCFMKKHAVNHIFLRSQEMFDWILNYHLMHSCPLLNKVSQSIAFTSDREVFTIMGVRVLLSGRLAGFYIFTYSQECFCINYLYYDKTYEREVFYSIAEHICRFTPQKVNSSNYQLCKFLYEFEIYTKLKTVLKSFAYPVDFIYDKNMVIQTGDGDNIT